MHAYGWAITKADELLVSTVSPTRRGAIVNWLVAHAGIMVYSHWEDSMIESKWVYASKPHGNVNIVEVRIEANPNG